MANPALTVIVPVYNQEAYVEKALTSLAEQTLDGALEVVVVLDAPTDKSAEVVEKIVDADPRFHVLALDTNIGLAGARQAGINAASGEYVGFLDADDWAEPNMYADLHAVAAGADIAGCAHRRVTPTSATVVPHPAAELTNHERIKKSLARSHSSNVLWFAWRNIYRRGMLTDNAIGFDPRLRTGEDMNFNLRAFGAANRVTVVPVPLINYRETAGSLTQSRYLPYLAECLQLAYDLKLEAARDLGLAPEFESDLNRYTVGITFPRLLGNAIADPNAISPSAAVANVLALPMIRAAVSKVPLRGSGLPKGIQVSLALAKARQPRAIARLYGSVPPSSR